MGPGTDVSLRIDHGHQPVDHDDRVAMFHDIDYVGAENLLDVYDADLKALGRFDYSLHGITGKIGMLARMALPELGFIMIGNDKKEADRLYDIVGYY